MAARSIEDELERLYGVPLTEFMAARQAAAAATKAAGDKAGAALLGKAKKPSLTAWAVNQVARVRRDQLAALLAAGDQVRAAHRALLRGKPAPDLREVDRRERELADRLVQDARELLAQAGHAATAEQLRKLHDTLQAAALGDAGPRAPVTAGRLTEDLVPASLLETLGEESAEEAEAAAAAPAPKPAQPDPKAAAAAKAAEKARQREAQEAAKRRAQAEAQLRKLEQAAAAAEADETRAEAEAERARQRSAAARAAVADAEAELAALPAPPALKGSIGTTSRSP